MPLFIRSPKFARSLFALGVVYMTQSAYAQDEAYNNFVIEEIVVTAQKRTQTTQDVGISITAFTQETMEELGIDRTWDIAAQIPNIDIKNAFGNSNPVITIRGIGINDVNTNNNPSAGIYIDDVYLGSSAMLGLALHDIQRVEVLKGPQGTLYGRNTTSGAISFFTNKPTEFFEADITASVGNYNSQQIEGAVSGPFSDNVKGRLAYYGKKQDGHYDSIYTGDTDYGDSDISSVRGILELNPSDDVLIYWSMHSGKDQSESWPYLQLNAQTSEPTTNSSGPFDVNPNALSDLDNKSDGSSVTVEWAFGDYEFASVSAYEAVTRRQGRDLDAGNPDSAPGLPIQLSEFYDDEIKQLTQEFRLTGSFDLVEWTTGFFYSNEDIDSLKKATVGANDLVTDYIQTGESYSLFGHSEWTLADEWSMIAGLRYTDESKDFDVDALGSSIIEHRDFSDDDVSGTLGLNYRPTMDLLVYASASKGFKSGGFDGSTILEVSQVDPFDSETILAYEIGFKATLLENRLQWNGATFFYDYSDMQLNVNTPAGSVLTNVGEAEIKGFDTDLWWRAVTGLDIKIGLGYLDGEITEYDATETSDDFVGNRVANAPEWTANGLIRYEHPLSDNIMLVALTDVSYQDEVFKTIDNDDNLKSDSYSLINARLSVESADKMWSVALWGKNLADKEYVSDAYTQSSLNVVAQMYGMPRTFGVSGTYRWD